MNASPAEKIWPQSIRLWAHIICRNHNLYINFGVSRVVNVLYGAADQAICVSIIAGFMCQFDERGKEVWGDGRCWYTML